MSSGKKFSPRIVRGHLVGVLCLALALITSSSALAAVEEKLNVTHLYNEAHSLTGKCVVSEDDKVEDPACTETPKGPLPPEGRLTRPGIVAVDAYGNQYVGNSNGSSFAEPNHIDIFDPTGHFIESILPTKRAASLAVDSTGHLYVGTESSTALRYDPLVYDGEAGEIEYDSTPVQIEVANAYTNAIAINPANDHFYVNRRQYVVEYGPPTDGVPNEVLSEAIGKGIFAEGNGNPGPITIDAAHNKIYVTEELGGGALEVEPRIDVLSASAPYELLAKFDGSTTPGGIFPKNSQASELTLAVDEASGNFFFSFRGSVYELEPDGTYVGTIKKPTLSPSPDQIAYDNGEHSPNQGYLYVPSGEAQGHLYAYEPIPEAAPPVIESISFDGVSEDEAVLHAKVNPAGEPTHYVFEYTTQQDFDENEFANAQVAGEGDTAGSGEGVAVSAVARGLQPGTAYRFRVRAENQCEVGGCAVEAQSAFTTFAPYTQTGSCSNAALRSGASAALPDCRAYELVTPPSTDGRVIIAPNFGSGPNFATWNSSPDGTSIAFSAEGGALSGQDTPGAFNGDNYVARRGASGWQTETAGLTARQASSGIPGGLSSDHGFAVVIGSAKANLDGELVHPGEEIDFIRYPDRSVHVAGEGSIGTAKLVGVRYISAGGGHIVFSAGGNTAGESGAQLEPNAPPAGTTAIYDRTPDQVLHVVSLLPGEVTPAAGQSAFYRGISADGSVVAFQIASGSEGSGSLYLRLDNTATVEAAPSGSTFAGLSDDGRYLFYLSGGALYRYDSQEDATIPFSEGAQAAPAYVSADGSAAYFTSKAVLTAEENPNQATAVAGQNNLYLAREGQVRFVATVSEADVEGDSRPGFSAWLSGINSSGLLPLRATPEGSTLIFVSRADLASFKSGGVAQIYRYDSNEGTLDCLSCDPTQKASSSAAVLLTPLSLPELGDTTAVPATAASIVPNLSPDGRRAFFESEERLLPADEDGLRDVYEWEAQGKGSCADPRGCLFLISSGQSTRNDYLYGVSESGDDVFIYTADLLNGEDIEEAPSVYDAKVQGGFPPRQAPPGECQGEACQPAAVAPNDPTPASSAFEGSGNVKPEGEAKARCPKGKKAAGKAGKSRCVPRHHKKQHKRAKAKRRAGR